MHDKKTFQKSFISTEKQLDLLKSRNLIFQDIDFAAHCLQSVSYYRLSAYFKPFQNPNDLQHSFLPETSFECIWQIYCFDRELRLLISDPIERIEVGLRTSLINALSDKYGDLWCVSNEPFSDKWMQPRHSKRSLYDDFKREIDLLCKQRKEEFIKHYFRKYDTPPYPPSWMLLECLSFGKCTNLFRHLKIMPDKRNVSEVFQMHPRVLESCLEPLRYLRNLCAHHSRLWNRWFLYRPKVSKVFGDAEVKPNTFYEQVNMLKYFNATLSPNSDWTQKLYQLFERYENGVPFKLMGFHENWQHDSFWSDD